MYRCQSCHQSVGPRVPCHSVTVATRLTVFPARPSTQRYVHDGRVKWNDDPGGMGPQIARELRVCAACASSRQRSNPIEVS